VSSGKCSHIIYGRQSNQSRLLYRSFVFIKPAETDLSDQCGETDPWMRLLENDNLVARRSVNCALALAL